MLITSFTANAGSIRCGGKLFFDSQIQPKGTHEVRKRCGLPVEWHGNTWTYERHGKIVEIRFSGNGEINRIVRR
jgi:hypothetical protein